MLEGYVSLRLQEVAAYYSNRISYEQVARLIERISGERLLSEQSIYQIVNAKAQQVSQARQQEVTAVVSVEEQTLGSVKTDINLYEQQSQEILLVEDGIQVKAQSAQRQSKTKHNN